jgi:hypothetical protein
VRDYTRYYWLTALGMIAKILLSATAHRSVSTSLSQGAIVYIIHI